MKNYILTGTPGSGKTSLIRALEINNFNIVDEAATDVISYKQGQGNAEPWQKIDFIDDIIKLQKHRQINASNNHLNLYFYDRSPICTYALAIYLNFKPTKDLINEIERIQENNIYQQKVFFIDNLGFIQNTDARKINFQDALEFEQVHIDTYNKFGYQLIHIPTNSITERMNSILEQVNMQN